jgi:hypothetical protein
MLPLFIAQVNFPLSPSSDLYLEGFRTFGERWTIAADNLESARAKVLARFADPARPSHKDGVIESLETVESWNARHR